MHIIPRTVLGWIIAVCISTILALVFSTQNVIRRLNDVGAAIDLSEHLSMTGYDIAHMGGLYGVFIAIALTFAFIAGALVYRHVHFGRPIIYITAGALSMFVMLLLMKQVFFGVDAIAGARDMFGKIMQMLAGAIGGYCFHRASRKRFEA